MRLQSSQLSMNLCDWWSRLNRFRNLDGFHPFILLSSLTIGPLGAKRQTWEPPYIRCAGNRKSPSQLSHFNGDKRTSIWEFRCSYHMMTSGRHGNVMWHIYIREKMQDVYLFIFSHHWWRWKEKLSEINQIYSMAIYH